MSEKDWQRMLEAIKSGELRSLVRETIHEKYSTTPYLLPNDKRVSMATGLANIYFSGRLRGFSNKLISWAIKPENTNSGDEGHGFALLLTQVLRHVYAEEGLEVFQSPARLDFQHSGDTADIVIGKRENRVVKPKYLIESKISYNTNSKNGFNKLLSMPVIILQGAKIFSDSRAELMRFAINPSHAINLARDFGASLKAQIGQ